MLRLQACSTRTAALPFSCLISLLRRQWPQQCKAEALEVHDGFPWHGQ